MTQAAVKPRRSQAERRREEAIAEADRLAALLSAAPPESDEPLAPPAFIKDRRLAPALAMWRELSKSLIGSGRLSALDRFTFAMLCYWHGEWIKATDDILERGPSFMVPATSGGMRPWRNPSVDRQTLANDQILTLSSKFGLTPLDRIALNKGRPYQRDDDELPLSTPTTPAPDEVPKTDRWTGLLQ